MAKAALADAQKAKEKKQKIFVAVGGVLLLGLMAFQVPKVLAMLNAKPPPLPPGAVIQPPNGFPPSAAQAPLAAPSLGGSNGTVPSDAVAEGGIVDTSAVTAAPASGQLVSFGRFASKDPFAQQVDTGASGGTSSSSSDAKKGSGPPPAVPPVGPLGPSGGGVTPSTPSPNLPAPHTVSIAINGVAEIVEVGKDFPAADPVFHLVALTRTSARIAIAGGSYADGKATVTLHKGKTLTLENTADGSLFTLRVLAFDPPPQSVATTATATTPATTTTATP